MLKSLTMDCQDYWLFKKCHPIDISVVNVLNHVKNQLQTWSFCLFGVL